MTISVLLDTSFFITLFDRSRPNHEVANKYYKAMIDDSIAMYLSTIVAAEFGIKQPIDDLPHKNLRVIPFNMTHSFEAAKIQGLMTPRDDGESRDAIKDDVKLIAQAAREQIPFILTDDAKTLYKYCDRLRSEGHINVNAIKLVDGFDPAAFRLDGQRDVVEDFS